MNVAMKTNANKLNPETNDGCIIAFSDLTNEFVTEETFEQVILMNTGCINLWSEKEKKRNWRLQCPYMKMTNVLEVDRQDKEG